MIATIAQEGKKLDPRAELEHLMTDHYLPPPSYNSFELETNELQWKVTYDIPYLGISESSTGRSRSQMLKEVATKVLKTIKSQRKLDI